jgi:hypothetical protein
LVRRTLAVHQKRRGIDAELTAAAETEGPHIAELVTGGVGPT